jgi:hypothetical protein
MGGSFDYIGDILVNRQLHFSDPTRFNDPFDCALSLNLQRGTTIDMWVEYFTHLVEEENPDFSLKARRNKAVDNVKRGRHTDPAFIYETEECIRQHIKELGKNQGVLCLSSDPKSVMMWARYADNHKGLLLRFDRNHMHDYTTSELRCFPMEYRQALPGLCEYLEALEQFKKGDQRSFARLFFCRKSREWKYEKEWRFFTDAANSFVGFDASMLAGIVFGWKMPNSKRALIAAWASTLNPAPTLFEAEPCPDRFRMRITRLKKRRLAVA